jgi:hypothetical protein
MERAFPGPGGRFGGNACHPFKVKLLLLVVDLAALLVELDEDRHFRAEDDGFVRLDDVVDAAAFIGAEHLGALAVHRRQENDGHVAGRLVLLEDAGGLDAVEDRHHDVHHDHRELATGSERHGFGARMGADQLVSERLEHGGKGDQVPWVVVHHQNRGRCRPLMRHATTLRAPQPGSGKLTALTGSLRDRRFADAQRRPRLMVTGAVLVNPLELLYRRTAGPVRLGLMTGGDAPSATDAEQTMTAAWPT